MMFDQRQHRQPQPSEKEKQARLSRFMLLHPEMDFSQAKFDGANSIQQSSLESLNRSMRMVQETERIGAECLESLQQQRESLQRCTQSLNGVSALGRMRDNVVSAATTGFSALFGRKSRKCATVLKTEEAPHPVEPSMSEFYGSDSASDSASASDCDASSSSSDDELFGDKGSPSRAGRSRNAISRGLFDDDSDDGLAKSDVQVGYPSSTASPADRLAKLVALQHFDGEFNLTRALAAVLGHGNVEALQVANPLGQSPTHSALWATALAIAFLQGPLVTLREDWHRVEAKARKWMTGALEAHNVAFRPEELINEAQRLISSE
mmetsp:Transcript_72685/g.170993  ORF Transcript_72685/g.170993 Transcript_72685/m.170993 type:complete len:322 (-) Transcript_72685:65-1030(-)